MDELGWTIAIALEVNRALIRVEHTPCGATGEIVVKPWRIPVVCNRIRGHTAELHSDGLSEWSE